jgi:hypothetical protein
MTDTPTSFRELIDLWPHPSIGTVAEDLGVPYGTVQVMRHRDSIASEHWASLVDGARRRRFEGWRTVTIELLARLKAAKARRPHPKHGISATA